MANVQILNKETLSERKYPLKYITYQKFMKNGEAVDMEAEVYYRPDATAILLYNQEQQTFLLTQQFRMPAYLNSSDTGLLTEACAGLIDEGETPEEAAIREAEEELGYKVKEPVFAGKIYTSAGGITELLHLYTAAYTEADKVSEGGGAEGENEDITLIHLSYTDAKRMLQQGEIIDAKTMLLLQHFFLFIQP
ncbi:GDP-mannose pyrophosphatase NudK [Mucilaginibacter koreensis]